MSAENTKRSSHDTTDNLIINVNKKKKPSLETITNKKISDINIDIMTKTDHIESEINKIETKISDLKIEIIIISALANSLVGSLLGYKNFYPYIDKDVDKDFLLLEEMSDEDKFQHESNTTYLKSIIPQIKDFYARTMLIKKNLKSKSDILDKKIIETRSFYNYVTKKFNELEECRKKLLLPCFTETDKNKYKELEIKYENDKKEYKIKLNEIAEGNKIKKELKIIEKRIFTLFTGIVYILNL